MPMANLASEQRTSCLCGKQKHPTISVTRVILALGGLQCGLLHRSASLILPFSSSRCPIHKRLVDPLLLAVEEGRKEMVERLPCGSSGEGFSPSPERLQRAEVAGAEGVLAHLVINCRSRFYYLCSFPKFMS
jgi:hypothetical protein